uniref:LOW QUALITY PROTEIN: nuclear protein MDM1-like n=1 Tax=Styela clava TaxID=7725 RepID=UPI00193A25A4|nr:LOW QUALITY PROTEIN: nuclear protein MDM1-like [Styela clava]
MPVLFKGSSEYKRNYKWNQSFRSGSFVPKLDQTAKDAGMRSDQVSSSQEPSFTLKKKVWHRDPQIQSCLIWWPDSDTEEKIKSSAATISHTEKGAASPIVKADKQRKSLTNKKSPEKTKAIQQHRSRSLDGSVILAPRKDVQAEKEADLLVPSSSQKSPKQIDGSKKTGVMKRTCQETNEVSNRELLTTAKILLKYQKLILQLNVPKVMMQRQKIQPSPKSSPGKREISEQPRQSMTSSKKSKQIKENIPLKHKAGLQSNKPSRTSKARLSEYQRNFMPPKFAVKQSPLLSALDVVHSSSPAIPPHGGIKFRPTTEYISNFKAKDSPLINRPSQTSPASPSMKARVRDLQNPQKSFFTHAKKKDLQSEYAAQFEAVKVSQAGELRNLAENNKQKHLGTHIDPYHATQVASPYNKCWEASSNGSGLKSEQNESEIDQEDLKEQEKDAEDNWSKASQIGSDHTESLDTETAIEVDSLEYDTSLTTGDSVARKLAWGEPDDNKEESDKKSDLSVEPQSILEGRLTTPRLQAMGGARRSHLDLTTPSKGGALLVSPSRHESSTGSFASSEPVEENSSPIAGAPTYDAQNLLKGRTHTLTRLSPRSAPVKCTREKGQRSTSAKSPNVKKESPMKRKQTPPSSSPIVTRHVSSLRNIRAPIKGSLRSEEFQHCGPLGRPQTTPVMASRDDDVLSVASSLTSARASELLQRAKERKSFWTTV